MEERFPEQIFRSYEFLEAPRLISRPTRMQTLNAYNQTFRDLMSVRTMLERRYASGEFDALGTVQENIKNGLDLNPYQQSLIRDSRTLLDANAAFYGRRNLNQADYVNTINQYEARNRTLTDFQRNVRKNYQAGDFHLNNWFFNDSLSPWISTDRFVVPVKDGDKDFAIIDGARVEGMIRFLDQQIHEAGSNLDLANNLRQRRDILYTQSSAIFENVDSVFHARNQLEAYYKSIDPQRREDIFPDWFNGEYILRQIRVLNIPPDPRGRNRWPLALPLLIPFLIPVCVGLNLSTSPCYGTGGSIHLEVFTPSETKGIYIEGANARQVAYHRLGIPQSEERSDDDWQLNMEVDRLKSEEQDYYNVYIELANRDYIQTAQRIRGDHEDTPWIFKASDFSPRQVLASCLSPQLRDQRTKDALERANNPQWWHPMADFFTSVRKAIPDLNITI